MPAGVADGGQGVVLGVEDHEAPAAAVGAGEGGGEAVGGALDREGEGL